MQTIRGIIFTGQQAEGAIPNGTRIMKTNSEPGDGNPDGTPGTVVGSIKVDDEARAMAPAHFRDVTHVYFIEWDGHPHLPVFVIGAKIARAN